MRKLPALLVLSLCLFFIVSLAYAGQGRGRGRRGGGQNFASQSGQVNTNAGQSSGFVDNNGDGICDNTGQQIGQGRNTGEKGYRRGVRDGTGPVNPLDTNTGYEVEE